MNFDVVVDTSGPVYFRWDWFFRSRVPRREKNPFGIFVSGPLVHRKDSSVTVWREGLNEGPVFS